MGDYVSPWMTEELSMLRDSAARFFEREFVPHEEQWAKDGIMPREMWNRAGAAGLLCASIPEEYGGAGGSFAHETVILYEQGKANVRSLGNAVHSGIVAHYILAYGSEEQKRRWLPKMAAGEMVGAIAMTEPGTGSDLQAVRATARMAGNQYVVNGQKTFITNGQHADLVIVVAKTDPDEKARGVSLIVVETDGAEGFSRGRNLEKLGLKAQDTSELFFDDVRVPTANLLGAEEGQGFFQLMNQLPQERLIVGIGACAAMDLAIELTTDYVKQRKAFGKRILDFQNTRFKLAECKTEAHIARVFVDNCLQRHLAGELDVATAAMVKWWCAQKQNEVIDECLQLFGGYGYMDEFPISRMYADARVQKIYGGTNEIMKELIARTL
ncbi:MAG: acyl-CoA dehydrogenase family protein [Rhodospirillaceae bacterium]|nr:acyl-CoA dehydrogenase family protein [Rhodospirillaceae bacterium]